MERLVVAIASLTLILIVFFGFALLLPACGIISVLPWWNDYCAVQESDAGERGAALDHERAALEGEIRALEREIAALECSPEQPPPTPEPEPPPEQEAQVEPPPEPEPTPPPEEELAEACEPDQKAVRPSEIMFVLDTSRSMRDSIDVPASLQRAEAEKVKEIDALAAQLERGNVFAAVGLAAAQSQMEDIQRQIDRVPGERRITIAREIAIDAIEKAPEDITIGLVDFNECRGEYHGAFSAAQRPALTARINNLSTENPTALAAAVQEAGRRMQGGQTPDDYVNMVVLTDGVDSCGGDPCAAARAAKAGRPGLVINVVDLSALTVAKCMADITGGFYNRKSDGMDLADLARSMREAAGYEGEGVCRN